MTVKSTVSFTDRHHQFAKRKVDEGVMPSVSSLVAMGIEQLMQDEAERSAALEAMKDTITRRMHTPREEWIDHESDPMFDRLRAKYTRS